MKFTTILISAFAGLALAAPQPQDATSSALTTSFSVSSTVVLSDASTTVSLTPVQTCLATCPVGDVTCQARCVGAARPNESQVNETNECVAQCDQGDGSPAATERYSQCTQNCIASYYPSTQTAGAVVGSGASTVASNVASVTSGAAASVSSGVAASVSSAAASLSSAVSSAASRASSATSAAASAASSAAAASNVQMGASAAGIAGLFMAVFAL